MRPSFPPQGIARRFLGNFRTLTSSLQATVTLLAAVQFLAVGADKATAGKQKETDDSWIQEYYLHPTPERFEAEVMKLRTSGALRNKNATLPTAAFFSRLFQAAKPDQLSHWIKVIQGLPEKDGRVLVLALRWADTRETKDALKAIASKKGKLAEYAQDFGNSKIPVIEKVTDPSPEELDMCWGAFFATGDPKYVLPIIRCATQPGRPNMIDLSQHAAQWSLKSLCSQHRKLRDIKDDFYKTAAPDQRKTLDELFEKPN